MVCEDAQRGKRNLSMAWIDVVKTYDSVDHGWLSEMFTLHTIGDKIVETLYLNRVTSENKRIRTPPLSPPFKVGVFVVFYR